MTTDVYVEQRWIDVPSVFGMTVREASERLVEAGFTPVASARRFSADAGDIVGGTLPPEGAALRLTARIDLLPARKEAVQKSADEALTVDQLLDSGSCPTSPASASTRCSRSSRHAASTPGRWRPSRTRSSRTSWSSPTHGRDGHELRPDRDLVRGARAAARPPAGSAPDLTPAIPEGTATPPRGLTRGVAAHP